MKKTGDDIMDEYYWKGSDILGSLGLFSEFESGCPLPSEVWTGIVQAIADASGYRIILQAAIVEPIEDNPDMMCIVGQREIADRRTDPVWEGRMSRECCSIVHLGYFELLSFSKIT